jgi:hypothetical protein
LIPVNNFHRAGFQRIIVQHFFSRPHSHRHKGKIFGGRAAPMENRRSSQAQQRHGQEKLIR